MNSSRFSTSPEDSGTVTGGVGTPSPAQRLPHVSVSLVSYNQRHHLERLLSGLMPAAALVHAEVLVVDYRSTDGVDEFLRREFPDVHVTRNTGRAGYGANHNLNLQRARGRYFVVMNSDMLVRTPRLFVDLRDYMDRHPDVGIVAPKVLNEDGTVQGLNKRFPSVVDLALRRFLPGRLQPMFKRRLDRYEMRDVGYDSEYDVEFISGAFMFCRTDALRRVGGFDPSFFMYFEDVDLCRRIQQSYRTAYCPGVDIVHCWERASHTSPAHLMYFMRSALRYFLRWGIKLA